MHAVLYPMAQALEIVFDAALFLALTMTSRRMPSPETPRTILLVRLDAAGDLVLFTGCLKRYRDLYPGWRIVLLVKATTASLAETIPWVNEVWALPTARYRWNPAERLRWRRRIARMRFRIVVNCSYSSSARHLDSLIGWSGAPRRIAMESLDRVDGRRRKGLFHTELVPASVYWDHESVRNSDLLRHLGDAGEKMPRPEVYLSEEDRRGAADLLGLSTQHPLFVVCPGAGATDRRWPAEAYVQAIRAIHEVRPHLWVLCGTPDERSLCAWIASHLPRGISIDLSGRTDLRQVSALIERAACVLGNESAPMHIAAAFLTPAVCILGGGFYGRFLPWPDGSSAVSVSHQLPCFRCYWRCIRPRVECIEDVPVKAVVDAVLTLLSRDMSREKPA